MMRAMSQPYPVVPLVALDTLWFQVAGTVCNLACTHCFISCSPHNHSHGLLDLATVQRFLDEARELGVKDYYFTGGEPFIHKELATMLRRTLQQGPATVLTNGTLIDAETARELKALADASPYSLDLRLSLDGWDAATNDPVRGVGTFARISRGIEALSTAGLNPIITVTEAFEVAATAAGRAEFLAFLRRIGLSRPRLKVMPLLRLGAESARTRRYEAWETLAGCTLSATELEALQCSSSRMVSSQGVFVCPILLDYPEARMGATLAETLRPYPLRHQACHTCHSQGLSCRT
jgi:molybdenum cofactor biosynthesis enzyme MoaA